MQGVNMWVVTRYGKVISWEKFKYKEDAEMWCLHNGHARLRTINKLGDKVIVVNGDIKIEKMG